MQEMCNSAGAVSHIPQVDSSLPSPISAYYLLTASLPVAAAWPWAEGALSLSTSRTFPGASRHVIVWNPWWEERQVSHPTRCYPFKSLKELLNSYNVISIPRSFLLPILLAFQESVTTKHFLKTLLSSCAVKEKFISTHFLEKTTVNRSRKSWFGGGGFILRRDEWNHHHVYFSLLSDD